MARIGALANVYQKFTGLEHWLQINPGKSQCPGGKFYRNGAAFPRSECNLANALEFQERPRDARHNVPRKKENGFLASDGALIDDINLNRHFVGDREILLVHARILQG